MRPAVRRWLYLSSSVHRHVLDVVLVVVNLAMADSSLIDAVMFQ